MLSKIDKHCKNIINISNVVFVKRKGRRKKRRRLLEGNVVVFVKRKGRRKKDRTSRSQLLLPLLFNVI